MSKPPKPKAIPLAFTLAAEILVDTAIPRELRAYLAAIVMRRAGK